MSTTRRSLLWPLMIVALGSLWLLIVAGAFPGAVEDVFRRAWPALVILFGLDVLIGRRRLRLGRLAVDTSLAGLIVTLALLAGVVGMAYRQQASVVRADNVQTLSKVLPDSIVRVLIQVDVRRTEITVMPAQEPEQLARQLAVEFKGSRESDVKIVWEVDGDTATLTLTEDYRHAIPRLEDYGRATLSITLPVGVSIDMLDLAVSSGDVTLNLGPVTVPGLALSVDQGNVKLTLPTVDILAGDLRVNAGNLELLVPPGKTLNLKVQSGSPDFEFDRDRYDLLVGGELKNKAATSFQYSLNVWMKGGASLRVVDMP